MAKRQALFAVVLILSAILIWLLAFWQPAPSGVAGQVETPRGGDFVLQSAAGPVSLEQFRGKIVLIYFGYTHCPDVCPSSLAVMAQALNAMAENELNQVQGLFISVDPERDSPQRLRDYSGYFHEKIIGLTGRAESLGEISRRYGAAYRKVAGQSAGGYLVDHTSITYIVAKSGALEKRLPHGTLAPAVLREIRALLAEG